MRKTPDRDDCRGLRPRPWLGRRSAAALTAVAATAVVAGGWAEHVRAAPARAAASPPASRPAPPAAGGGGGGGGGGGAKPDALAILEANCVKCHGGGETKGGLDMMTREGLLLGSDSGATVVPGKPADSLLIQTVTHEADPHMPPKGPRLSADAVATLTEWVKAGVPYPRKVNKPAPAGGGKAPAPPKR